MGWGPLAKRCSLTENWTSGVAVVPTGKGRYVFTDDFAAPDAVAEYQTWIAKEDEIRYRFGDHTVVLRRGVRQRRHRGSDLEQFPVRRTRAVGPSPR